MARSDFLTSWGWIRRIGRLLPAIALLTTCDGGRGVLAPALPEPLQDPVSPRPGALLVWGDDTWHQVSGAPLGTFQTVAGGSFNGLALRRDGTPVLWGVHLSIGPQSIPPQLAAESFRAAAIGRDDAVLIRQDGTLAAFGRYVSPSQLPPGAYRSVSMAAAFAVAIRRDGSLTTWEWPHPLVTPTGIQPPTGSFQQVASSVLYALALDDDGRLYGWGQSDVFDGWTPMPDNPAVFFLPRQTFKSIAAGNGHALAIHPNGTVTGWGSAGGGALLPPTHVRFKAVDAGWGFSIGLAEDGTLWGWGIPHALGAPTPTSPWTFASQGWSRYRDTDHYYVPGQRFDSIAAAAFHLMAIAATR